MISIVVPAHNEEAWLARSLSAIHLSMETIKAPWELILVDDSSTDSTASIGQKFQARVLRIDRRHIAAARNAGAQAARGDTLFFVDADTLLSSSIVKEGMAAMRDGAVGGGCVPKFEGHLPVWWRLFSPLMCTVIRMWRMPGGACQFCTRRAYELSGGYSEHHFAGEDNLFTKELKKLGRFVVLREPVITSGRNLRSHSFSSIAGILLRFLILGPDGFRRRQKLDLWYRPKREKLE